MDVSSQGGPDFDRFFAESYPEVARAVWFVVFDEGLAAEIAQGAFCRALRTAELRAALAALLTQQRAAVVLRYLCLVPGHPTLDPVTIHAHPA